MQGNGHDIGKVQAKSSFQAQYVGIKQDGRRNGVHAARDARVTAGKAPPTRAGDAKEEPHQVGIRRQSGPVERVTIHSVAGNGGGGDRRRRRRGKMVVIRGVHHDPLFQFVPEEKVLCFWMHTARFICQSHFVPSRSAPYHTHFRPWYGIVVVRTSKPLESEVDVIPSSSLPIYHVEPKIERKSKNTFSEKLPIRQ
jgi:hypothetical protein